MYKQVEFREGLGRGIKSYGEKVRSDKYGMATLSGQRIVSGGMGQKAPPKDFTNQVNTFRNPLSVATDYDWTTGNKSLYLRQHTYSTRIYAPQVYVGVTNVTNNFQKERIGRPTFNKNTNTGIPIGGEFGILGPTNETYPRVSTIG